VERLRLKNHFARPPRAKIWSRRGSDCGKKQATTNFRYNDETCEGSGLAMNALPAGAIASRRLRDEPARPAL
jgi:hypothetical protein